MTARDSIATANENRRLRTKVPEITAVFWVLKLLTTGIWTTGAQLRSPMPQFRMDRGDAEAVVAYLKSLTPQQ